MSAFLDDTFIGTTGTDLATHSPDTGGAWSMSAGGVASVVLAGSGTIRSTVTDGPIALTYANAATPPGADYQVTFDLKFLSSGSVSVAGVLLRSTSGETTGYFVGFDGPNAHGWCILKYTAGTGSVNMSSAFTPAGVEAHTCVAAVSGSTITLTVDGTPTLSWTDGSAISGAGVVSVALYSINSPGDSTNVQIGHLIGDEFVGPPVAPVPDFTADLSAFIYYGRYAIENGTQIWTINNGLITEFAVRDATVINLCFDVLSAAKYPAVAYWVDGVGPTRATTDGTGLITISFPSSPYDAVSYNIHRVRFVTNIDSEYPTPHDNWTDRRDALRFLGIQASGGTMIDLPTNPSTMEVLGDSITGSLRIIYTDTDGVVAAAPEIGWPAYAAELLGLKPIVNGHGGQGITTGGTDGAPVANSAFGLVYAAKAWNPAIPPTVVVVYHGTNDSTFTSGTYQTYLMTIRAAYPAAYVFAVTPDGKSALASAISGAVTAMADARIFYLDYSSLGLATTDGLHPTIGGSNTLAIRLATDIQAQLDTLGVKVQESGTPSPPAPPTPQMVVPASDKPVKSWSDRRSMPLSQEQLRDVSIRVQDKDPYSLKSIEDSLIQ